jgi:hypothetical protein
MKLIDGYGGGGGQQESERPRHRSEELYVSEEYKIFMIAGTPDSFTRDPNHISVRPFHSLPPATAEAMHKLAKPWTAATSKECDISIRVDDELNLELVDGYTQVKSKFPLSELDEDVREDLLYKIRLRKFGAHGAGTEEVDPWAKYVSAADALPRPEPNITTGSDVSVQKPLSLLRKPGALKL